MRPREYPSDDPEIEAMSDVGKWQNGKCPTCASPIRWRWTGLRAVARMGDENLAGKEYQPIADSPVKQSKLVSTTLLRSVADRRDTIGAGIDAVLLRNVASELDSLRAVVAKLPKTVDGVPIYPGMHIWFLWRRRNEVEEMKVFGWEHLPGLEPGMQFVVNVCDERGNPDGVNLECCYSTRESALAAGEGKR